MDNEEIPSTLLDGYSATLEMVEMTVKYKPVKGPVFRNPFGSVNVKPSAVDVHVQMYPDGQCEWDMVIVYGWRMSTLGKVTQARVSSEFYASMSDHRMPSWIIALANDAVEQMKARWNR